MGLTPTKTARLTGLFDKISDPKKSLTLYAGQKGYSEAFPEALSIGTHPQYDPSDWLPEVAAFIDAVVEEAMLP